MLTPRFRIQQENVCAPHRLRSRTICSKITPDRTKRIKDAKSEAHKEIEEYRHQKEDEFKKFEAEVSIDLHSPVDLFNAWWKTLMENFGNSTQAVTRRSKKTRARKPKRSWWRSRRLATRRATR